MFMVIHACGYFLFLIITLALQAMTYEILLFELYEATCSYELVKVNSEFFYMQFKMADKQDSLQMTA